MPRPGPRPYECVRRAWHSDRHRTIRGSLIREIFRVVSETHSSEIKKNKEWQEKLPVVVLKVEEIIYSKANTEAEYMDLKTLWDRANDAVNTIIRLDESTETGQFLQPCIEAALSLGCVARRTSRSQRNNNLRCYLGVDTPEPSYISPTQKNHTTNSQSIATINYKHFPKQTLLNSFSPASESENLLCPRDPCTINRLPYNQSLPMVSHPCSSSYSAYPLFYGNHFRFGKSQHGSENCLNKSICNSMDPVKTEVTKRLFSCNIDSSVNVTGLDLRDITGTPHEMECDLSLRLGSSISPSHITNDLISTNWRIKNGNANRDVTTQKRKAVLVQPDDDDQTICWQSKLPFYHLPYEKRN